MRFIILLKPLSHPLKYYYCHLTVSNLPKVTQLVRVSLDLLLVSTVLS